MQLLVPALIIRDGSYRGAEQHFLSSAARQEVLQHLCHRQAPRLGSARAHHVPWAGCTLESPPGRIQGQELLSHQSPLVFRAPFQFFLQFDDINQDKKSWNTLHFGAFEDHEVSSAAGTPSAVAQVGTCCSTPQIIPGHPSASATLPLCPGPVRPARIQPQLLPKAGI